MKSIACDPLNWSVWNLGHTLLMYCINWWWNNGVAMGNHSVIAHDVHIVNLDQVIMAFFDGINIERIWHC